MNPQFKRKLIGVAVASCFAGTAWGNPVGPAVVGGTVGFSSTDKTLTVTNSPGAIINWQSFSIAADEATRFIQQSAASSVLNRVVGVDPSLILGLLQSNGRVFLINPSGILFGATARIDVPGFVASTLDISNADFLNGRFNFAETAGAAGIKNEGSITTSTGGFVYLVATDVQNTGIITSPQGEVILAAGKSVELVNSGSPDIRVVLTAPDNQAINVGSIVAKSGRIGIYGGLISQQGVVNANTVVKGESGEIIFKATQGITLESGSVTTASGEGRGVKDGGEIRIIADGALAVKEDAEVLVKGGPRGGNGGFLELSGKSMTLDGILDGSAQPGYMGGSLVLDPGKVFIVADGTTPPECGGTGDTCVSPSDFRTFGNATILAQDDLNLKTPLFNTDLNNGNPGGTLTLGAGNDVTLFEPIGSAAGRFQHSVELIAGDNVNVGNNIYLGGAHTLTLAANSSASFAAGALGYGGTLTLVPSGFGSVVIGDFGYGGSAGIAVDTQGAINVSGVNAVIYGGTSAAKTTTVTTTGDLNVSVTDGVGVQGTSGMKVGAVNVSANNVNVEASFMGVSGNPYGGSVKINATNDLNINLSGSTCLIGECGAFGVIGGMGNGAFAEVTAGNDIKIRTTDLTHGNAAVWGGGGSGAYAKLRAGNDLVLDLRPNLGSSGSFGGGWLDVFANGGGNNAYAEASAGRNIESRTLTPDGYGGLIIGASTQIGGVIVEGGHGFGTTGNVTATLSAGYDAAGMPRTDGQGSIALDLAYGMEVEGGTVDHVLDGAADGASVATDASALMRAAQDINISVAGAPFTPAVQIKGGMASAEVFNAASGTAIASATADATVLAYGGAVSITVANGNIEVFGGSAEAEALHEAAGVAVTANHQATARAKTRISAAGNVTLDAQNGVLTVNGGFAGASAGHSANVVGAGTLSGNNTATAYGGLTITGGASSTVSLHGYGGVTIDPGYGGAFAVNEHGSNATGMTTSGANTASAYGGLAVSGGTVSITADSGPINVYAPAALAIATHWLDNANGANVTGNNKAYAEFNLALTASGADSILIDAGANGVQLGGGSSIFVDDFDISFLPRGAMARAENNVFGSASNNSVVGDNTATAKAAMSFTSAGSVTVSGSSVNIYGQQIAAIAVNSAVNSASGSLAGNSISGNNTAVANGALTIEGASVSVTANGSLSLSGGNADADAHSVLDSSGAAGNLINAAAATNLNKAEAYGGVTFNATGGNLMLSAANGGSGSLNIQGGGANANAHKDFDNSGSGSGNVIRGDNTATASNKMVLKASGNVDIETTGGTGQVQIGNWWWGNNTNANAYNEFSGYGGEISGAHNATATGGMEISAGAASGAVTIASYGGYVQIYGPWRNASAYNMGNAASNFDVSGSNTATVNSELKVAGASVSVTAGGSGWLTVSGGGAGANAYSGLADGAFDNFVDTANTATVNGGVTFNATAGNLTFSAANGSVNIYGGEGWGEGWGWGWAQASKQIANLWWGEGSASASATDNELLGDNIASASNKMMLAATGNVNIETTGGTEQVNISAGGGMATAHNGLWAVGGTSSAAVPVTVADNVLSGDNEATLTGGMDITAGTSGTVTIASYGGNVYVNAPYVSADAENDIEGGGSATLSGNSITGNNTAAVTAALNVTGGTVTVTANQYLSVYGGGASVGALSGINANPWWMWWGATGAPAVNNNTLLGDNTATATGGTTFNATAGNLTFSAANGDVNVNGGWGSAQASKQINDDDSWWWWGSSASSAPASASATGNELLGDNTASASNKMAFAATGNVDIKTTAGTGQVYIKAQGGMATAQNGLWAVGGTSSAAVPVTVADNVLSGDNEATLTGGMEISAGATSGTVSIASYGGGVYVNDASYTSVSAEAGNYAEGFGGLTLASNSIAGNNTATATAALNVSGGSVTVTANQSLSVFGGYAADADAHSVLDSSGAAGNLINAAVATNLNKAEAYGGVTFNATGGNLMLSAANGGSGSLNIYGGGANADAYKDFDNSFGSGNVMRGGNTAWAENKMVLKASGDVDLETTAGLGSVNVTADGGEGRAYASFGGYGGTISGDHSATYTGGLELNAGGTLTVASYGGSVSIEGASAEAQAYKSGTSATANMVSGTYTAGADTQLKLTSGSGGDIVITAQFGITLSNDHTHGNSAYSSLNSASGNTVSGDHTVTLNKSITVNSGRDILITSYGGSIGIKDTHTNAFASAYQYVDGGADNQVSGINTATVDNSLRMTASRNIAVAAGADVTFGASTGGADAWQQVDSGSNNTLSGTNTATTTNNTVVSAGNDLTVTAGGLGTVSIAGSEADASGWQQAYGYGNTIGGTNTASAEQILSLKAGQNISITGAGLFVGNNDASASAYQSGTAFSFGGGNNVSGTNTATATQQTLVEATSGNITVAVGSGSFSMAASEASASAYKTVSDFVTGSTLSGNNTATAAATVKVKAGGNITVTAGFTELDGSCCDDTRAYQNVNGNGNVLSGNNAATASNTVALEAGGSLTVNGTLSLDGGSEAEGSAYQSVSGDSNTLSGQNTASLTNKVSVTASGTLTVTGSLNMNAASPSSNSAYQSVSGTGNNVNGTNASTMNLDVALSAGTMNLSTVNLSGTSAGSNNAYQSVSGSGNTVGGSNTVNTATTLVLITPGALTIAGGGLDLSPGYASASAYRSAGSGNTVSGTNSATVGAGMAVAAGSLTVASGDVSVKGGNAGAYTSGTGDNRATAKSTATLNAGSLTANGGSLYVNGGWAYASHSGSGAAAPVADASATVNSAVVNVSGDVFLDGGTAYTFTSGSGAPQASANASILMGAGAETMTIGGSLGLFGGFTDFTGAGIPSAYALIDPGQLTITTGGNVHLFGGEGVNTFAGLHAEGPIVLNIGGSELELLGGLGTGRSGLFDGTGTGFEPPGTGSNITVSFTGTGGGTILVDNNTCSFCGDAFVRTELTATVSEFAPPAELFRPQESPTPPDEKKEKEKEKVAGDTEQTGTQEEAPEGEELPSCS